MNYKNIRGITLIALVVTIIVILILAGVAINAVVGDNGILSKAQKAVQASRKAEFEEKVKMNAVTYAIYEISENNDNSFLEFMKNSNTPGEIEEASVISNTGEKLSYEDRCYIKNYDRWYTVYSDGSMEEGKIVWDGKISDALEKDGDVYLIKSPQDLAFLAQDVYNGNTYEGCNIRLETSIDLGANKVKGKWIKGLADWLPIGYYDYGKQIRKDFKGIFDGQGYTIRGIYLENPDIYAGIFGRNAGVIKNLNASYNFSAGFMSGSICGFNMAEGIIENCTSSGTAITTIFNAVGVKYGGICANNWGTIRSCVNDSDIIVQGSYDTINLEKSTYITLAGIDYCNYGTVESCKNLANINLSTDLIGDGTETNKLVYFTAAGIVNSNGSASVPNAIIKNCYNSGDISIIQKGGTANLTYASGICIFNNYVKIENTFNEGKIYNGGTAVWTYAAGITAYNDRGNVDSCYNTGKIINEANGEAQCGGITGQNTGLISNCYNTGIISGRAIGRNEAGVKYGGVAANTYIKDENIETGVKNSYSIGSFEVDLSNDSEEHPIYIAGVIAYLKNGTVSNCYYLNTVAGGGINKKDMLTEKNKTNIAGEAESKTATEMKNSGFVNILNTDKFKEKSNDYPILKWQ